MCVTNTTLAHIETILLGKGVDWVGGAKDPKRETTLMSYRKMDFDHHLLYGNGHMPMAEDD